MNPLFDGSTDISGVILFFCGILGLIFGSFLNVCITRLPRRESLISPRSRCPGCGAAIAAYDNIPLLSWLLLRGRCRSCRNVISWRYPAVEAATAGLFVACYLRFGLNVEGIGNAVFCFLLLGLLFMDAETMLLPDAFTLPGIALGVLFAAGRAVGTGRLEIVTAVIHSLLAAALAAGLLLFTRWLYWIIRRRQGLGLGDVKLLAMMAAWLPLQSALLAFFLAIIAAAIFAVALLAIKLLDREKINHRREASWLSQPLPLGSFLAAAALCCIFFAEGTLKWYAGLWYQK